MKNLLLQIRITNIIWTVGAILKQAMNQENESRNMQLSQIDFSISRMNASFSNRIVNLKDGHVVSEKINKGISKELI